MKIFTCSFFIICTTNLLFGQNISGHIEALAGEDAAARLESRDAIFAAFAEATAPSATEGDSAVLEAAALVEIKRSSLPLSERLYLLRILERFGSEGVAEAVYPLLGDASPPDTISAGQRTGPCTQCHAADERYLSPQPA